MLAAHGAVELGVSEAEDPTVGGHQVVPHPIRRAGHAHDRAVQMLAAHASIVRGVEGVDRPIGGDHPVAPGGAVGRHTYGIVDVGPLGHGSVGFRSPIGDDAPASGYEPVAHAVRRGGHAHDRLVQARASGGPVERGIEGEEATVTGDEVVPT